MLRSLREDNAKIKKFLMEKGKAEWKEIAEATEIPAGTLSKRIHFLHQRGDIDVRVDPKNLRRKWISLTDRKKAQGEVLKYEATSFIESLKDPSYVEKPIKNVGCSLFVSSISKDAEKYKENLISTFALAIEKSAEVILSLVDVAAKGHGFKASDIKMAWVITYGQGE